MTFRGSKLKSAGMLVACCALPGLGVLAVTAALSPNFGFGPMIVVMVIGGGLIAIGLLCLYVIGFQLMRRGPIVTIDQQGILDVRNGLGLIPWSDIRDLRVSRQRIRSNRGIERIGIYLVDPTPYLLRLPGWKRALTQFGLRQGMPVAEISFVGLTPGIKEAVAFLRQGSRVMLPEEL